MVLRLMRRLAVGLATVAAVGLAPAAARADTQILVQEIVGNAPVAGTTQVFASSTNITTSLPNFSSITITANSNSGAVSSLTTTVNATPISVGFDPSIGVRVIVTTDGFITPNVGGRADVSNNASASSAIAGGQNMLTSITQLLGHPLTTPTTSTTTEATGATLGAATALAADVRPSGGVSPTTGSTVLGLPGQFAIQQQIDVQAINVGSGGISSGSTLGGSASSLVVTTAAVPAPGGLALALIGLPLIGLRRALRKKPVAA
jgi:hypothetical protein